MGLVPLYVPVPLVFCDSLFTHCHSPSILTLGTSDHNFGVRHPIKVITSASQLPPLPFLVAVRFHLCASHAVVFYMAKLKGINILLNFSYIARGIQQQHHPHISAGDPGQLCHMKFPSASFKQGLPKQIDIELITGAISRLFGIQACVFIKSSQYGSIYFRTTVLGHF